MVDGLPPGTGLGKTHLHSRPPEPSSVRVFSQRLCDIIRI